MWRATDRLRRVRARWRGPRLGYGCSFRGRGGGTNIVNTLFPSFLPQRQNMTRNCAGLYLLPLDIESASIPEQSTPDAIPDSNRNSKRLGLLIVPLTNLGVSAEEHWESKRDPALIESLLSRSESEAAFFIDGKLDVDGQVFV